MHPGVIEPVEFDREGRVTTATDILGLSGGAEVRSMGRRSELMLEEDVDQNSRYLTDEFYGHGDHILRLDGEGRVELRNLPLSSRIIVKQQIEQQQTLPFDSKIIPFGIRRR